MSFSIMQCTYRFPYTAPCFWGGQESHPVSMLPFKDRVICPAVLVSSCAESPLGLHIRLLCRTFLKRSHYYRRPSMLVFVDFARGLAISVSTDGPNRQISENCVSFQTNKMSQNTECVQKKKRCNLTDKFIHQSRNLNTSQAVRPYPAVPTTY